MSENKYGMAEFDSIQVGESRELVHRLTGEDIVKFADLTGDNNPLHIDKEFAQQTDFRRPVAHGMLSASFISTIIGMRLPGPGSLWLSQTLKFLRQAHEGDMIRVVVRVKQKSKSTRILVLETNVYNQRNEELISGEAQVRVLELRGKSESMEKKTKVVIVTGASRGIGAAIAKKLALNGHMVVVNYSKSKTEALNVVEEIKSRGGEALAIQADISNPDDVDRMCNIVAGQLGPINALVQNASGAINMKDFDAINWEDIQAHLDIQVKGAFQCVKTILPGMLANGGGSVVMIGSIAAESVPPAKQLAYIIAKSGLAAMAKSLAVEYGPKNIRFNVVAPGLTETDLTVEIPQKAKELTRMTTPVRRLAQPEDIANTVAFLISQEARHITGETIRVCGGSVMV